MSEVEKIRHLCLPYCVGNGCDIGSGGDPTVPNAIQVELPMAEYVKYRAGDVHKSPIQWHGDCFDLPFKDCVLDFIASHHLIEDFDRKRWPVLFREWRRCLKPGGYLVISVPERARWKAALERGQIPNCSHHGPEPLVGDITHYANYAGGLGKVFERLTNLTPEDYTILAVLKRI